MTAQARAARLLRWYPRGWRDRYGAEFTELLMADLAEQPRSWRRTADVARAGLLARLSRAGLGGQLLGPADQVTASLITLGSAVAVFLTFGTMVWSQLVIGWQWAPPGSRATSVAVLVMSAAMALFLVLALLAAVPVGWCLARVLTRRPAGQLARGLAWPGGLATLSAAVLIIGGRHVQNGWPGTGGPAWPHQAWCRAAWPRSAGPPPCRSARTGLTRPRWRPSRRARSPGWRSAQPRWPAWPPG